MNKRIWLLLLATYVISLLISAPASLLGRMIFATSDGRIELANTSGSLWQGSAYPLLHQQDGGMFTLSPVHWRVLPQALLNGKLGLQLEWDNETQTVPMLLYATFGKIELQQVYLPLPAELLGEASEFLKVAVFRGKIIVKSPQLNITPRAMLGTATADWLNASSLLSAVAPLGNYHLDFSSSASGVDVKLSTTSGALLLDGQGHYSMQTGLNFHGTAQAASGKEDSLRELLSHLGPQLRPGVNTFTLVPQSGR